MTEVLDRPSLKALSVDTRQEIMKLLAKRPHTSSELSKILGKHVTTISEHLGVLESSGLVRRREDEHKWVYYVLAEKGEKIFKPAFYSWVVMLSLSVVAFIAGAYQIFLSTTGFRLSAMQDTMKTGVSEAAEAAAAAPIIGMEIYTGIALISVSMIVFGYLIGNKLVK